MGDIYLYVLLEGGTELDAILQAVVLNFQEIHDDAVVKILVRKKGNGKEVFECARQAFQVQRSPALAFTDQDLGASNEQSSRYISFGRDLLERCVVRDSTLTIDNALTRDALYMLLADLHYAIIDEGLLRLQLEHAGLRVASLLKAVRNEIKGLINIKVAPL